MLIIIVNLTNFFLLDVEDIPVDVYAIGFEEIVDLNASNIVSAR